MLGGGALGEVMHSGRPLMSKVSLLVKETPDTNIYPVSRSVRDVHCLHPEVHDIFVIVALMS